MINRKAFYARVRNTMFNGKLTFSQVKNMQFLLDEWEARGLTDLRQLAYIFATVYHETAETMAPIAEYGKGKGHKYGTRVKYNGKPYQEPHLYYGRGHTQNTWWDIYKQLTIVNKKEWDFVNNPDLLLQVEPSIWATFHGMTTGLYTGRKLSTYFNNQVCDWHNARRIINGIDCADKIANYAKMFYLALK